MDVSLDEVKIDGERSRFEKGRRMVNVTA